MAHTLTPSRIPTRVVAAVLALALVIAATAVLAASSLAGSGTIHTYVQRSGTMVVSGYDGGAALAPATSAP